MWFKAFEEDDQKAAETRDCFDKAFDKGGGGGYFIKGVRTQTLLRLAARMRFDCRYIQVGGQVRFEAAVKKLW